MTSDQAREAIRTQRQFGGGHHRRVGLTWLGEIGQGHDQGAVDGLIRDWKVR